MKQNNINAIRTIVISGFKYNNSANEKTSSAWNLPLLNKGTRTTVNVYRKNPFGEYEDVQLKVTIKEK